jgi:succinate dehydrogenase/fumarate reductase flavoprotein subunit
MSHLLGCHTNTGDGALMAAEAGAAFSGMEFSAYYTVAPAFSTMTRSMSYAFATYTDAAGRELDIPQGRAATEALARAMQAGPVFCSLHRMPADIRERLTRIQPNLMLPFLRHRIDPFSDRFEVTLRGEGTIRGTGGLQIASDDCGTTVEGLYAAGDVATRELVAGAISGGGAQNSAWALSSGRWAGQAASRRAQALGRRAERPAEALGGAGLRPTDAPAAADHRRVVAAVQAEMLPTEKNLFRSATSLAASRARLDTLWREARAFGHGTGRAALRSREAAAMIAHARWCIGAALARSESRGMHRRIDAPARDARFDRRLAVGGLDRVWTRPLERPAQEAA